MKKVVLLLNGPMCAGKSTVAQALMQRDGFYKASYDTIKWLISNYSAENPEHRMMGQEVTFASAADALRQGLSVVVDGANHKFRKRYQELAQEHGADYVSVSIEAPYDVLKERFHERVAAAGKVDRPFIAVTTDEGYDLRYNWYLSENKDNDAAMVLDSSTLSLEQIVAEIDKLLAR